VVVGAYAATAEIYRIGMNVASLAEIGPAWERAIANPIAPSRVVRAPCQEIVLEGAEITRPAAVDGVAAGAGLDAGLRRRALSDRDGA